MRTPCRPASTLPNSLARTGRERQRAAQLFGPGKQRFERRLVQPVEHHHLAAGEQRPVQGEAGVLGRGTDQHDRAILHHGQKGVLLGAVEAVHFIDEQQRAALRRAGGFEHPF